MELRYAAGGMTGLSIVLRVNKEGVDEVKEEFERLCNLSPILNFKSTDIEEREELVKCICEQIWSLEAFA